MPLTLKTKLSLLKVYRLCEMLLTHYEDRDYVTVINLLHKIAHEHIKICESEVKG